MPRTSLRLLALVVLALAAAEVLSGGGTGLLYAVPALLLALPLVHGRYVAEERLAGIARRRHRPRRWPVRMPAPRSRARVMERGGRLVARAMAKRPPPVAALPHIA